MAALGVVAALVFAGFWGLRVARGRVLEAVERRGGVAELDWIWPSPSGWVVRGLRVRFPDAPSVSVEVRELRAPLSGELALELDGEVRLDGERAVVLADLDALRGRTVGDGPATPGPGGRALRLRGLAVRYRGDGEEASLRDLRIERNADKVSVGFAQLDVASGPLAFQASAGSVEFTRDESASWRLRRVGLDDVHLELRSSAAGPAGAAEGEQVERGAFAASLRPLLERLEAIAQERLSPDARIELRGLRGSLGYRGQTLNLGPASLVLRSEEERRWVEYLAGSAVQSLQGESDGLVLRVALPKSSEPLELHVRGGPISLAALGVRDGDFHLRDTALASLRADARLTLDTDAAKLRFHGEAKLEGLGLSAAALSREPLRGLRASFRGKVESSLDARRIEVEDGELEIGQVRVLGAGKLRIGPRPEGASSALPRIELEAKYSLPLVPCQTMLDAAPEGLLPTLKGMRMAGSFGLDGHARFDTASLDKSYDVAWRVSCTCRVTDVPPSIDVARFSKSFKLRVPSGEGRSVELDNGPGTSAWTPYGSISRFMELGVIGFEDGRFHRHEGFDQEAIRNSLRENLRSGRFVRGASTISMQLAKNLYLPRDKTLSRKIEEAVLTLYLEQALTKQQIVELYLNVVEFGPMVYGVDAAASHYFNTSPSRLSASQAFYLASILPNPKHEHFAQGGQVSAGWLKQLRTVMRHAHKRGRLSDDELATALSEIPVRGSSAPMRDPDAAPAEAPSELGIRDAEGDSFGAP